ncbi:MAG: hypothetical protein AAGU21_12585 [Solidesulfovibrio sp.]|uniref:hypothetical protein n=1 Tax=Solidesulfovibrio sp. TaxID=2910990 RepID=UPI002B21D429|nr:hypothetical protein [Solidesulfovibrio sp.]MEA4855668.1 hypothetical protein [Solidesulfovibrio sp.]
MGLVIGIDLDNTVIDYDGVFFELAAERGWLPPAAGPGGRPGKRALRDALRAAGPAGEDRWRWLQAQAYGPRIGRAALFPGVAAALAGLAADGARLHVVSHKTARANHHDTKTDLRRAALDFLAARGLTGPGGPLGEARIHFRDTRREKLDTIRRLGCRAFVDDLPEVLGDPDFPPGTVRVLFDPAEPAESGEPAGYPAEAGLIRCRDWAEVGRAVRRLCPPCREEAP